jgi:hypothetical protein
MAHRVLEDVRRMSSFVAIKPATAMLAALGFIILRRIFRVVKIAQVSLSLLGQILAESETDCQLFPEAIHPLPTIRFPGASV